LACTMKHTNQKPAPGPSAAGKLSSSSVETIMLLTLPPNSNNPDLSTADGPIDPELIRLIKPKFLLS